MVASGKTYFLANQKAGTVCDLSGQDNRSVIGWEKKTAGNENEKWEVTDTGGGNGWTVKNVSNGKYLDIDGPPQNGTKVVAVDTDKPRTWDIRPYKNDKSANCIFVRETNFNVDLSDHGNPASGTAVTLWDSRDTDNQAWRFEQA